MIGRWGGTAENIVPTPKAGHDGTVRKHRSTLYQQLGDTIGGREAVGALLSNIASRELDEPASREFVAAQIQTVRTEVAESEGRITRYIHEEIAGFRTEIAQIRSSIDGIRSDISTTNRWMRAW